MYMWPTARANEKDTDNAETFSCDPNPVGPIANNPDPTAVQLTMEFEHFAHPVIFPNDVPTHVVKERYVGNCILVVCIKFLQEFILQELRERYQLYF